MKKGIVLKEKKQKFRSGCTESPGALRAPWAVVRAMPEGEGDRLLSRPGDTPVTSAKALQPQEPR